MSAFQLNKLINNNIKKASIVASTIIEYDIEDAHATAIRFIMGEDVYNSLMSIPNKHDRKIQIGLMRRDNRELTGMITELILKWMNEFLAINKISERNFLATTPDSILLVGKVPTHTTLENGKVVFRNKEKITFSSLFLVENGQKKLILFDRMTKRIRIKGLGEETVTNQYHFVNKYLKNLLCVLDDSMSFGYIKTLKKLKTLKYNYIHSHDIEIYRSISHNNQFHYVVNGEDIFTDTPLEESETTKLIIADNYMDIIFPLIKSMI